MHGFVGKLPAMNHAGDTIKRQRQRLSQDTQWLALGRIFDSPD
jgi:hypothetical protein